MDRKPHWMAGVALLALVYCSSCSDSSQEKMENTTDSIAAKVEHGMDRLGNEVDSLIHGNADENFLSDALESNTRELRALRLGVQKGGADVKVLASRMMKDHARLGSQLRGYLTANNISLSGVDTAEHSNDLANMPSGKDFDKAWSDKMVDDHQKMTDDFTDAEGNVQSPDLKTLIAKTIPVLQSHLEKSRELQQQLSTR